MLRKFAGTMIVQKEKRNSPERFQISGNFKAFGKLSEITKYVLVFFYFVLLSSLWNFYSERSKLSNAEVLRDLIILGIKSVHCSPGCRVTGFSVSYMSFVCPKHHVRTQALPTMESDMVTTLITKSEYPSHVSRDLNWRGLRTRCVSMESGVHPCLNAKVNCYELNLWLPFNFYAFGKPVIKGMLLCFALSAKSNGASCFILKMNSIQCNFI